MGLWKNPALGSLNHLNEAKTWEAAESEIQTGERVTQVSDLCLFIALASFA